MLTGIGIALMVAMMGGMMWQGHKMMSGGHRKHTEKHAQSQTPAPQVPDAKAAVYACPMGDYSGPQTKDGRCPKCGMSLSLMK